jgi:hypothetical protein
MAGPFGVVSSASTNAVAVKWHAGNDRGVARLDGSAARFIKRANAPWPRRREKIENGVFSAEWRAAQGEVHGEDEQ